MKKAEEIARMLQFRLDSRKARSEAEWEEYYVIVLKQIDESLEKCKSFVRAIVNINSVLHDGHLIADRIVERLKDEGFVEPSASYQSERSSPSSSLATWAIELDIPIEAVKNRQHLSETRIP